MCCGRWERAGRIVRVVKGMSSGGGLGVGALLRATFSLFAKGNFTGAAMSSVIGRTNLTGKAFCLCFGSGCSLESGLVTCGTYRLFSSTRGRLRKARVGSLRRRVLFLASCVVSHFRGRRSLLGFLSGGLS